MCKPPCWLLSVAVIAFWAGLCSNAFASFITYTDRSAWEAASVGLTNIDFEGITPPGTSADFSSTGLTLSGAQFDGIARGCGPVVCNQAPSLFVDNTSGNAQLSGVGEDILPPGFFTKTITVSFHDPITSFGSDFVLFNLEISSNQIQLFSSAGSSAVNNPQFVGFTSSEPVSQIVVSNSGTHARANLDNVAFGTAAAVPEPSTSFLLLAGCVCVAVRIYFRLCPPC
jgi:hypothetical protein